MATEKAPMNTVTAAELGVEKPYGGKGEEFAIDESGAPPQIGLINAGNARALQLGFIVSEDNFDSDLLRAVLAEFMGCVLFLFNTITVIIYNNDIILGSAKHLFISLSFGLNIFLLVWFTAGISGGNLNPAVTLTLVLGKRMSVVRGILYIVAQCVGAIIGAWFAELISFDDRFHAAAGGANIVTERLPVGKAVFGEMLCTFLLCFGVLVGIDAELWTLPQMKIRVTPTLFAAVGIAVTLAHFVLIPIDGCSINPARSFGPAVIANEWDEHWVFWLGPFMGSVLAVGLWELVFRPPVIKT